jgi:hypothetical protein
MGHKFGVTSCVICASLFTKRARNHKYCSDVLRHTSLQQRLEEHPYERTWFPEERGCEVCGEQYMPRSKPQKYCSPPCALAAQRTRNQFVIFRRDGFKCAYCGRTSFEDGVKLNADHINPVACGGQNIAANLITSCRDCNQNKTTRRLSAEKEILEEVSRRNKDQGISSHQIISMSERSPS